MRRVLIAVLVVLFSTTPSAAFELLCQEDVSVGTEKTIGEDLIVVGDKVKIKGEIKGDFIGVGRNINCEGVIEDDVTVIGRYINIKGNIGDSLRAVGERIKTDARIKGDIIIFGRSVELLENSSAKGDAVIGGEEIEIDGKISRNLKVYGKRVKIRGEIAKDVKLNAERITLFPGARIGGDLSYTCANKIEIRHGAQIIGKTTWQKPMIKGRRIVTPKNYSKRLLTKFLLTLPILLIGLISIAIAPKQVHMTADVIDKFPWKSLGAGFVFLICIPAAAAILFATIIGIPLALIILLVYFSALYVSKLFAGMYIAMKILHLQDKRERGSLALALTAGCVIVVILSTIPKIGGFIGLLLIMFGLGGFVISRWKTFILAREKGLI